MLPRVVEFTAFFLVLVLVVTQLLIPLLRDRPLWPMLSHRRKLAERERMETNEDIDIDRIQAEANVVGGRRDASGAPEPPTSTVHSTPNEETT